MKIENKNSAFKWLKDIPCGECFRDIDNDCIYLKTHSTEMLKTIDEYEVLMYGCVEPTSGILSYTADKRVMPVHAKIVINHSAENEV
jgi:hypothetical protein